MGRERVMCWEVILIGPSERERPIRRLGNRGRDRITINFKEIG
jgi:hypothetical protein